MFILGVAGCRQAHLDSRMVC